MMKGERGKWEMAAYDSRETSRFKIISFMTDYVDSNLCVFSSK